MEEKEWNTGVGGDGISACNENENYKEDKNKKRRLKKQKIRVIFIKGKWNMKS